MENLKGKIYWVEDDFNFNDIHFPKNDETSHSVTNVENAIIAENMISFKTTSLEIDGVKFTHSVNLMANDTGFGFTGTCTISLEGYDNGVVVCELFQNAKTYFLYGKWIEEEILYTWWAKIDK